MKTLALAFLFAASVAFAAEQTAFGIEKNRVYRREVRGQENAVLHDLDLAVLAVDEEPLRAVRRPGHARNLRADSRKGGLLEIRIQRRCRCRSEAG